MRTLIIHNPASGHHGEDIFSFMRSALDASDEIVVRTTSEEIDAQDLVDDAASFDAVVASGGDGTVARVAYAVRDAGVPVLVFPSGTANLLANNIGNACEPAALAQTLRDRRLVQLDMGELVFHDAQGTRRSRGFLTMAGAGFDADIMRGSQPLKQTFGQFSYYLAALGSIQSPCSHLTMELDGQHVEADGICALAGVWGTVNAGLEIIPESNPSDGLIDLMIIKTAKPVQLLPAMVGVVLGQGVDEPYVEVHRVREATITCDPPLPMQFDGEVIEDATTPFTVRAIPGGLTTFVDALSPLAKQA